MMPATPQRSFERVLVTGGAGFVGSAMVRHLLSTSDARVLNFDKLTYAADLGSLKEAEISDRYEFVQADIGDRAAVRDTLMRFQPDAIIHAAAETHVDRSIADPTAFVETNLLGTYSLLTAVRDYWDSLSAERRDQFRFLQVSTDEVYGSLGAEGLFSENSPTQPSSPYSATKAGSDHLALAWQRTYGMPVLITHCSNNYGPFQFPEKLIPRMILTALVELPLPIYGTGENTRDWLFVDDHVRALDTVLCSGRVGETYNIGGNNQRTNIKIVRSICQTLDELRPRPTGSYSDLIAFVADRPGHDMRYAIDASKIRNELGWSAKQDLEAGLRTTVAWYLENEWWWKRD